MQKITKLLCALLLLFSVGMQAQAVVTVNKYINPYTGSDSNSGDSWEEAWKTLDHAMLEVSHLDAADTGMWDYQLHITQGYFVATKTLNNNGWNKSTHATQGHVNNSMILLRQGTKLTITGGYSVNPSLATSEGSQPHKYPTLIYKADVSGSSFVRLINGNGGGIALKNLTFTDIRGGAGAEGSLITVDGAASGYVAEDKTVELDNVIIHNWQGDAGAIYVKGAINTEITLNNILVEQQVIKKYGSIVYTNDASIANTILVKNSTFRNTNLSRWLYSGTRGALIDVVVDKSREDNYGKHSTVTIEDSEFLNNKRSTHAEQSASVLQTYNVKDITVRNSKFYANRGGFGGVFWIKRVSNFVSEQNVYQSNHSGHYGGAYTIIESYDNNNPGNISIKGDKYYRNLSRYPDMSAGRGGAIFVANGAAVDAPLVSGESKYNVDIKNTEFKENLTGVGEGGALFLSTKGNINITNSIFCRNISGDYSGAGSAQGGAIYTVGSAGTLNITNTTFESNSVRNGYTGGAILAGGSKELYIDKSRFWRNYANNSGGAIKTSNTVKLVVTNSAFDGNSANVGGAINAEANNTVQLINNTFEANEARNDDGGAVRIETGYKGDTEDTQHKIINNKFYGNVAGSITKASGNDGGALFIYNTQFNGPISNNLFYANQAYGRGGAIHMDNTVGGGIRTIMKDNIFDWNEAGGNGGAINILAGLGPIHNNVVNNKFYRNEAGENGGAVFVQNTLGSTNYSDYMSNLDNYGYGFNFVNTEFKDNKATGNGGAIYIYGSGVSPGLKGYVNAVDGCKFYGNQASGTYNSSLTRNDDISFSYAVATRGQIHRTTNTYLQNAPTAANYKQDAYNLVAPNYQSDANTITVDPAIQQGIDDFLNFNYNGVDRPWKVDATLCENINIQEPPLSPQIQSRWGVSNEQSQGDYVEYTRIEMNDCDIENVYLKFVAETNRPAFILDENDNFVEYSLPEPAPALTFTYFEERTNNETGVSEHLGPFTITAYPSATFEIDENDGQPRRFYKSYFLDVTSKIKPNSTHTFYITKVEGENGVINDEFTEKQIITTIYTSKKPDSCLQCFFSANTTDGEGIPTIHGITTLTKAGGQGNWPMARIGAWTALESSNKGFVITRLSTAELTNITNPQEGMMVYDTTDNCLKIYNGTSWKCVINQYCE